MEITVNEYDALKAVEAAARSWLTDFENRYDGCPLPNLQEIQGITAALAALDAIRKEVAR